MEIITSFKVAFPDIKFTIEDQIAEGDMVVSRVRAKGTHKGEYQGVSPTNKNVEFTVTAANRIVNYKIVERWTEIDALGILSQLGAVPELTNQS
jgi:predicted ester cyclase